MAHNFSHIYPIIYSICDLNTTPGICLPLCGRWRTAPFQLGSYYVHDHTVTWRHSLGNTNSASWVGWWFKGSRRWYSVKKLLFFNQRTMLKFLIFKRSILLENTSNFPKQPKIPFLNRFFSHLNVKVAPIFQRLDNCFTEQPHFRL